MNRFKVTFALAAVALALVCVASVEAARMDLSINYAGSFDPVFNPLPANSPLFAQNAPHNGNPPYATPVPGAYHQFDVFMTLTEMAAGEDFGVAIFDLLLGPGVTPSDVVWNGAAPVWDPPGPATNQPIFSTNADSGSDPADLKAITVIANSANSFGGTHASHPGEAEAIGVGGTSLPPPTLLGSAFVRWDGTFDASSPSGKSWVAVGATANVTDPWATVTGTTANPQTTANLFFGPREEWIDAPEIVNNFEVNNGVADQGGYIPGSTVTGGPLPTNDDDSPDDVLWALLGLTRDDDMGGPNPAVPYIPVGGEGVPTVDAQTGEFSWTTAAFTPRGAYAAIIQGTNSEGVLTPAGTDTGLLTWNMVPEPTSITLLGLAMIGAIGFIRRR